MKTDDFNLLSGLVKDRSGLVLTEEKAYLLESRLMPVARKWNMAGLDELVQSVRVRMDKNLLSDITEAMTTNESLFFRDMRPFDQLRDKIFPALIAARAANRKIRIWSAACSTGQEPYSIALTIKELGAKMGNVSVEIIATDISAEVLKRAKSGIYSQFEVQRGLPIQMLVKYFKQDGDKWALSPEICRMVQFREFNLLDSTRSLGQFDIVLCRNVLIYFDRETKGKVLGSIADVTADDGYMFLGGAETVLGITDRFAPLAGERGVYQKK